MNIRIIKIADCGKLTAPNTVTLTYNIGIDGSSNMHFRTTDNKTGGLFSTEWIALDAILDTVKDIPDVKPFSALIFDRLFTYRSANNAGFLVAALLAEGVLQRHKETKRMVILGEPDKFLAELKPLVDSDTSLYDVIAQKILVVCCHLSTSFKVHFMFSRVVYFELQSNTASTFYMSTKDCYEKLFYKIREILGESFLFVTIFFTQN